MRDSGTMKMKVGLLCLECDNRWEVEIDAKDSDESVEVSTFCQVCDGEDVIVEYVDHPTLGRIDTALPEEADDVIDTYPYHCPDCGNTYFLTANIPNRCPYCPDDSILDKAIAWLKGKTGRRVSPMGTVAHGKKVEEDSKH